MSEWENTRTESRKYKAESRKQLEWSLGFTSNYFRWTIRVISLKQKWRKWNDQSVIRGVRDQMGISASNKKIEFPFIVTY